MDGRRNFLEGCFLSIMSFVVYAPEFTQPIAPGMHQVKKGDSLKMMQGHPYSAATMLHRDWSRSCGAWQWRSLLLCR